MASRNKLLELGLDISNPEKLNDLKKIHFEAPVRIGGCHIVGSIQIGAFTYLHDGFLHRVNIGRYCSVGKNFVCLQPNHELNYITTHPMHYHGYSTVFNEQVVLASGFKSLKRKIETTKKTASQTTIENDVWIGMNVTVLNGVKISNGAVIGAGSVVTKNIPPYAVVAGNPAKIIKYRFNEAQIQKLLQLKWWEYDPEMISKFDFTKPEEFCEKLKQLVEDNKIEKAKFNTINKEIIDKV